MKKTETHIYTVSEIDDQYADDVYGTSAKIISAKIIKVTVSDADGYLKATADPKTASPEFVNTRMSAEKPSEDQVTVPVFGSKVLEGGTLSEGQFTFELHQNGMAIDTADNAAVLGLFEFDDLVFDEPGTYEYQISEIDDGQEGIIYDDSVYTLKVKVANDPKTGGLKTQTTLTKEGREAMLAIFTNQKKSSQTPSNPPSPSNGSNPSNLPGPLRQNQTDMVNRGTSTSRYSAYNGVQGSSSAVQKPERSSRQAVGTGINSGLLSSLLLAGSGALSLAFASKAVRKKRKRSDEKTRSSRDQAR